MTEIDDILRRAESMKLFERDGLIHYGKWRAWWRAGRRTPNFKVLSYGHSGPVSGKLHLKLCGPDE